MASKQRTDAEREKLRHLNATVEKLVAGGLTREDAEDRVLKAQRRDSGTGFTREGRSFRRG